jgi:hypothetical protein
MSPSVVLLDSTDYSQVNKPGVRCKSANFAAEKSPDSPDWRAQTGRDRASVDAPAPHAQVPAENYPFCTIDPSTSRVNVPGL